MVRPGHASKMRSSFRAGCRSRCLVTHDPGGDAEEAGNRPRWFSDGSADMRGTTNGSSIAPPSGRHRPSHTVPSAGCPVHSSQNDLGHPLRAPRGTVRRRRYSRAPARPDRHAAKPKTRPPARNQGFHNSSVHSRCSGLTSMFWPAVSVSSSTSTEMPRTSRTAQAHQPRALTTRPARPRGCGSARSHPSTPPTRHSNPTPHKPTATNHPGRSSARGPAETLRPQLPPSAQKK